MSDIHPEAFGSRRREFQTGEQRGAKGGFVEAMAHLSFSARGSRTAGRASRLTGEQATCPNAFAPGRVRAAGALKRRAPSRRSRFEAAGGLPNAANTHAVPPQ